jgi:hypothetical protein
LVRHALFLRANPPFCYCTVASSPGHSTSDDAAKNLLSVRPVSGNPIAANPTGKMRRLAAAEGWGVLEGGCALDGADDGSVHRGTSCCTGVKSSSDTAAAEASIPASLHHDYSKPSAGAVQNALGIVGALPMLFSAAFGTGGGKL